MKNIFIKPLTLIINQMINTVSFPDKLKNLKILQVFKKDDEMLFTNYRPTCISLLPVISKLFESIIFKQLYNFFVDNTFVQCTIWLLNRTLDRVRLAALELIDQIIL